MGNIKKSPRFLAMELLVKIRKQKTYSNIGLNQFIRKNDLNNADASLLTNLVYGVLQYRLTLEFYLKPFIKKARKIDPWVYELLLLAIYQMEYLDRIPIHAIFNETIEIAKIKGHAGTRKFVTGILHNIKRQGLPNFDHLSDEQYLSIKNSVPIWIVKQLINSVGLEKTNKILQSVNQKPNESLRVNVVKNSKNDLQVELKEEDIETTDSKVAKDGLVAQSGFLAGTQAFKNGKFIIQDESAMLVEESMNVAPGEIILDACSAPGGKTTQIAAALKNSGKVVALDIHEHKLKLVEQNALRLGVNSVIETQKLDARKVSNEFPDNYFDQILVDAPCSGIGLIRRKPEIRYDKTLKDSLNLAKIQLSILDSVADKLKVGGKLTYSTCTILPTENQTVVDSFLKSHSNFVQIKTKTAKAIKDSREDLGLTIYPDDFNSDGFFIATLVKK
nr:16S rRNA (cytosine(967)-C(5))-methyltransferase RsmB [uncultured Ligilactobacillus sp.]